ncbi:hypothetical protein EYB26_004092 [Talaromyces marneffei]|uniref:uncharacterized protein n=1 Tax=Talaromyces marneffei TaxID=37727 RepID=UPI0012A970F3|nr:uncharacterized protein EYB26_004092 [Talaromyces marneffei]QGA16425.1 hypothetical protein EYB26_004092 [Talaromyces marneffei]
MGHSGDFPSAVDCTYPENDDSSHIPKTKTKERMAAVEEQLSILMKHMKQLANNVQDIRNTQRTQGHEGNAAQHPLPVRSSPRGDGPTQPQFIGPTSFDYNFNMARNTLQQMGIQSEDLNSQAMSLTSPFPSRAQSLEPTRTPLNAVYRWIGKRSSMHLRFIGRNCTRARQDDFRQHLVDSVEDEISTILRHSEVSIPDLQILTLTSIYYFHCDEPVLAWRRIGNAARAAIEIGLHRRETLEKKFLDVNMQTQALKIFWCIYVLDHRWGFGIGIPFVLHDEDIDPALPTRHCEPYLRCMISYGQICSKVWKTVAGFTNINSISKDTLIYPRLGDAAQNQPRILQMLRTFLCIRANHMRIYVHRHHILSPHNIAQNSSAARLVIDIAKDTIHVLVHLRETSTLYETQQVPFNYFLVSAFSAIFLGVCNAPERFSQTCRTEFYSALELLYTLSARSSITRRLWKGIKGLRQIAPRLGLSPTKLPEATTLPVSIDNSIYNNVHQTASPFPPYRQRTATTSSYISDEQCIATGTLAPTTGFSQSILTSPEDCPQTSSSSSTQCPRLTSPAITETISTLTDPLSLPAL